MAIEVRDNRESAAVDARTVLAIVGGFVVFAALVMVGAGVFFRLSVGPENLDQPLNSFPIPQVQANPTEDYLGFRRRQNDALAGYAWADRDKGLVHVPIARAMALVAARGSGAYDPPDPGPAPITGQPPSGGQTPSGGQPPDGMPRAVPSLPASPYGTRP